MASGTPYVEKQTLQQMWTEAMAQFEQHTGTVLNVRPPKTLEDITKQIDIQQTSYAYDSNEQDLKTRAKSASMNVLYCLKLLGGVAAQGASMVSSLST